MEGRFRRHVLVLALTVPPMPGHPDWTANPVTTTATAARSAAAAPSARELELGIYKR